MIKQYLSNKKVKRTRGAIKEQRHLSSTDFTLHKVTGDTPTSEIWLPAPQELG